MKDMHYRFLDDNVTAMASQLSYSIIASIFPFLIFLFTLTPFLKVDEKMVLESLKGLMPGSAYELVQRTVTEVLNTKSTNLLSISLIIAIWSASSGIRAVMTALNKAYDEPEKRAFYKLWGIGIIGTVALAITIALSFVLLVFGGTLGDYFQCCYELSRAVRVMWDFIRFILSVFILIMLFSTAYFFLPSRRLRWKEVIPGAIFGTFCWILASMLFSYYVNNFSNYSRFYGSIAAVFVLMTWIYISSIIVILGGELNASFVFSKCDKENCKERA